MDNSHCHAKTNEAGQRSSSMGVGLQHLDASETWESAPNGGQDAPRGVWGNADDRIPSEHEGAVAWSTPTVASPPVGIVLARENLCPSESRAPALGSALQSRPSNRAQAADCSFIPSDHAGVTHAAKVRTVFPAHGGNGKAEDGLESFVPYPLIPEEAESGESEEPPSDEDFARPLAPPKAERTTPLPMLSLPKELRPPPEAEGVEQEWLARKRVTGAIGRLVHYGPGQAPQEDILGLYRTRHRRLMVMAVRRDGVAARAGVAPGDELISINGIRVSEFSPAQAVLPSLQVPVSLVFLGFAGKLQAEVRVRQPDRPRCGLPPAADVLSDVAITSLTPAGGVHLLEAVVFNHSAPSLLLATDQATAPSSQSDDAQSHLFELLPEDAKSLLARAMRPRSQPHF